MSDPPTPSPYHESEPLVGKMFRVLYLNNPALIEPGSRDDHIECNLSPTSLGQHPQFTALSYCWDVPEPKVPILCNGVKLQVRPNLQSALRQLRLPEKQVCIWADALCINQDDLEERVRQVKFMKEIFEAAAEVIVWLGDESDDSDIGMQAAKELADAARKYLEQRDTIYNMPADDPLVDEIFGKFRRGSEYPRFHALSQILNRNWFHRTWVVQEAAVARKLKILCGGSVMTWEDFTLVASLRSQLNLTTSANDKNVTPLILANTRLDYQNGVNRDLLSIMYRHRVFEATVPRDKVYGLGGLAGDDIAKHFMANVDYAGHEFVLYREVAAEMLKRGQLGVLSVAPGLNREHADGLPTWAPDWRVTRQSPCLGLWNEHDIHLVRYKASGDSEPSVRFNDAGSLLALECCRVDTIEAVGDIMIVEDIPHGFPGILRLPKFAYMLDNWRQVTRTSQSAEYPTSEPIADAFVQTLVGGPPSSTLTCCDSNTISSPVRLAYFAG
ncbi:unnamed protein product [Parascedosporium putredinis]|uniref:Heterokaryon incompatibility domain-containing protein n=1 Tax=Parascedosporium putredinis TaxID=1442378 RepID=A0A9P1M739_9PEZI|nr:unnamed protein product [Parascedosporium putredinis]CAI7989687.1 unnamed protein product [Parascedosporium putredinis]